MLELAEGERRVTDLVEKIGMSPGQHLWPHGLSP
ncbi:MAG TPA: hypothetical protein VFF07_01355 [Actinomycetota bacterium]|nr:hypothetical protein [Actinomycetota bacterium]